MSDQENPTQTPAAPTAPAGWYDDPNAGTKRYWDGSAWAEPLPAAAPAVATETIAPAPIAPSRAPVQPLAIFALVAGGLAFLLGLVPGVGVVFALGGIVLAILAFVKKHRPTWMPLVGVIAAGIALLTNVIVIAALANGQTLVAAPTPRPSATQSAQPTEEPKPVTVPNVVGMSAADAMSTLEAAGLEAAYSGEDDWKVSAQDPAAGAELLQGESVTLTAAEDFSLYVKLDDHTFALMAKDPDAYRGQKIIMYGTVWQFDTATGTCNALVDTDDALQAYSYDYGVNTWITGAPCSILDPVVQGDHVEMYVIIDGAYDYETAAGGTNTAVSVKVHAINVLAPQEY